MDSEKYWMQRNPDKSIFIENQALIEEQIAYEQCLYMKGAATVREAEGDHPRGCSDSQPEV